MTDQTPITNQKTGSKAKRKHRARILRAAAEAERQRQSAAVAAANWTDRDGKARPTPERMRRGNWHLIDGEDAGVTVARDSQATELDRMQARRQITPEQCQAGHDFAALMWRTQLVREGRSCMDFSPKGHDESEPSDVEIRDEKERALIYRKAGAKAFAEMRRVCVEGYGVRDAQALAHGLDVCIKLWC